MPPKIKISYEQIMQAAIEIVRESGPDALSTRTIAKRLGCSVHPIFRACDSMEGLYVEVYKRAEKIYNEKMEEALQKEDAFYNVGITYIRFAKEEKNLFKLLFMTDAFKNKGFMDIVGSTKGDDEVLDIICQTTGLTKRYARELYAGIWLTTHGMATMFATNNCKFSDEEVHRILDNSFIGLVMKLKDEMKKTEGNNE